jgi:hypothetical protein
MKSGPLSNPDVIKKVNAEFIPVEINLTDEGFPSSIPALQLWQKAFEVKPSHKLGFALTRAERTAKDKEPTEEILRSLQEANRGVESQGR